MTLREMLISASRETFEDEDEEPVTLNLLPGLSAEELAAFERRIPGPLPKEVADLLTYAKGMDFTCEVDFTGRLPFGMKDVLPNSLPIVADGFGNFWVVDIRKDTGAWGPVLFACHDPPVIAVQSASLADFLGRLLDTGRPDKRGGPGSLDFIHDDAVNRIYRENPGLLSLDAARGSTDEVLSVFAGALDPSFLIADLRQSVPGSGFNWGRHGSRTRVVRHPAALLWGIGGPRFPVFVSGKRTSR